MLGCRPHRVVELEPHHARKRMLGPGSLGRILLGNTFHLANRPTCELLRKCGGLHKLMNWCLF